MAADYRVLGGKAELVIFPAGRQVSGQELKTGEVETGIWKFRVLTGQLGIGGKGFFDFPLFLQHKGQIQSRFKESRLCCQGLTKKGLRLAVSFLIFEDVSQIVGSAGEVGELGQDRAVECGGPCNVSGRMACFGLIQDKFQGLERAFTRTCWGELQKLLPLPIYKL